MNKFFMIIVGIIPLILSITTEPLFGMTSKEYIVAGLAIMMGIWWIFEAISIYVTGLVPIVIAPLLGLSNIKIVSHAYFNPIIFLFFGGFILGAAIEKWNLHKRVANRVLKIAGTNIKLQVAGFMFVSAFLSMWLSNTTTTIMLLPTVTAFLYMYKKSVEKEYYEKISKIFLLSVAYSATIGGMSTLIGTPPNAFLASFIESTYNYHISFSNWLIFALPISTFMLICIWLYLTTFYINQSKLPKFSKDDFENLLEKLPRMERGEISVLVVVGITIIFWIFKDFIELYLHIKIGDAGIAMAASILLFIIPSGKKGVNLLEWEDLKNINYGILFLFGGGIALAGLFISSGLSSFIASNFNHINHLPMIFIVFIIVVVIVFLTEITSNTATSATFLPLIAPIAVAGGIDPLYYAIPVALSASCAFMLPVATPPNAIVFGSGELKIKDMARVGFWLNIFSIIFLTLYCVYLIGPEFDLK